MISVCILTKNSARSLARTLDSLSQFPEILVLDTGSQDETKEIARSFSNVRLVETPFTGFGMLRNIAAQLAAHDWILALDSDEFASQEFIQKLMSLTLDPQTVYELNFHNYYRGRRIVGCGWNPKYHIRLYHRNTTKWCENEVHEDIIYQGLSVQRIEEPVYHIPYLTTSDFLHKMQLYSDLFAKQYQGKRKSSFSKAFLHGLSTFFKSYFLTGGCINGTDGFVISFYNATTTFYKYLKLAEINSRNYSKIR
jgi:glycosyltransferase involved in cell wall biosynthesis